MCSLAQKFGLKLYKFESGFHVSDIYKELD